MRDVVVSRAALAACLPCALCACGGDAASVRLVPVGDGVCGRPADARSLLVTPLGDFRAERRAIALGDAVALADLPASTRQLAVEVIGDGAAVLAQGKTAPFELGALGDGDVLAIAMAPPDGFCPAATMIAARDRPLVARAGGGVLIAGGLAPLPLATAEWFDPATGTTREVAMPAGFVGPRGLAGASLVPLPDGRVALVGGPSPGFAIYDPDDGAFGAAVLVSQVRAHAAAVALDDERVMLLGGCGTLTDDGACEPGAARADTRIIDLTTGAITDGAPLVAERARASAFLDVAPDGRRAVVVIGGVDGNGAPLATAERLELDGGGVITFAGAGAAAAATDSGTLITAFAPDGAPATGTVAALVPGVAGTRPLAGALPRAGAVLVTQEDGLVIALGGGTPQRFLPAAATWSTVDAAGAPPLDGGHAAIGLDDGSIFVAGGRSGGVAQAATWRFRPRLLGPFTGSLTVVPGDDESDPPLTPLDPAFVTAGPPWRLLGAGDGPSHAIVGGPAGGALRVDLTAVVPADGVGVVLGHVGPADHHLVRLVPDQPAALVRVAAGTTTTRCLGGTVPPAGAATITVDADPGSARVAIAGRVVLTCDLDGLPAGRVGVAALGAGEVEVITIAVTR